MSMMNEQVSWDPKTCHIAALVLARGGSKGLPLKNIRECAGIPLIGWVLRAIRDSEVFDSIWVSTDHPDIAKAAKEFGAQIHWRSAEVSQDTSSSVESSREFLQHHPDVEVLAMVQCTSPGLQPFHLRDAINLIRQDGYESVFSVVRRRQFRWKEVNRGNGGTERTTALNFDPKFRPRRQEWDGELYENGSFYIGRRHLVMSSSFQVYISRHMHQVEHLQIILPRTQGGNLTYYEMDAEYSVDIDTEFDLQMAEVILQRYGYHGKESGRDQDDNQKSRLLPSRIKA